MGEAFPEADEGVIGAGQTVTVWAGPTPVSTTALGGRGGEGRVRWAEPCRGLPRWAGMP